jgi:transposase
VFYQLEERIAQMWLLNAQHLKIVPGRKTDLADLAWIAQLVEHGLVRPSFVAPPQIRQLRDFSRHRRVLSEERTRMVQRLEKVLQDAGIKLTSVASTVLSKSGRAMLEAAQILAQVDFLDRQLTDIDEHISALVADLEPIIERVQTIPGVARKCAIGMIAEIGVDMTVFPTAAHLASWAGICRGNNASGGKARSGHTRWRPIASTTADRGSPGRWPHQEHLPGGVVSRDPGSARHAQDGWRDPPRHLDRLLAHRLRNQRRRHASRLPRPRPGLDHPPSQYLSTRSPSSPTRSSNSAPR